MLEFQLSQETSQGSTSAKQHRGGSWASNFLECRSAIRSWNDPKRWRHWGLGFRVAQIQLTQPVKNPGSEAKSENQ